MRFCPYCGMELVAKGVLFCTDCGKKLPEKMENGKKEELERTGGTLWESYGGRDSETEYRDGKKQREGNKVVEKELQGIRQRNQEPDKKESGKKMADDGKQKGEKILHEKELVMEHSVKPGYPIEDSPTEMKKAKSQERTALPEKKKIVERKLSFGIDNYDGYYDDILPIDEGHDSEGLDGELVRKILLLLAAVLLIIGMCVALMYVV